MSNVQHTPFKDVSVGDKVRVVREYRNDTSRRDGQRGTVIRKNEEHDSYPFRVEFEDGAIDTMYQVLVIEDEKDSVVSAAEVTAALRKYATTAGLTVDQAVDLMLVLAELGLYERGNE